MELPKIILLISGKRKSGKDYLAEKLFNIIGKEKCCILRISEPIKSYYAKENNLNLSELMSGNAYKEKYREDMIKWSDSVRLNDPGYFCKITCLKAPQRDIWIVSDIRRKTDINWFKENYKDRINTIRISSAIDVRKNRGWVFKSGVDDVTSECDLDDYEEWNLRISNNNHGEIEDGIQNILKLLDD